MLIMGRYDVSPNDTTVARDDEKVDVRNLSIFDIIEFRDRSLKQKMLSMVRYNVPGCPCIHVYTYVYKCIHGGHGRRRRSLS